jgi:hypothetical protein
MENLNFCMDVLSKKDYILRGNRTAIVLKTADALSGIVIQCFKMYSVPNVKLNLRVKCIMVTARTIRANICLGYKSY